MHVITKESCPFGKLKQLQTYLVMKKYTNIYFSFTPNISAFISL